MSNRLDHKPASSRFANRILDKIYVRSRPLTDVRVDGGVASFTFDDFRANAFHNGGAILEEFGWRGTYYTCGGLLGERFENGILATRDEVEHCHERGHEIANHTLAHYNLVLCNADRIRAQITKNAAALPMATSHLAYPYGSANIREQRIASRLITTGRGVQRGLNSKATDRFDLRANPIYSALGLDWLSRLVNEAIETNSWIIFYTHDVTDNPSEIGCTPSEFRELADIVNRAGIDVKTIEDAAPVALSQLDPNNNIQPEILKKAISA